MGQPLLRYMVSPAKKQPRQKARKPNKSLRLLRKIIGFTQKQLAQQIGVSEITIKKIESGDNKLTKEMAGRIFATMGVTGRIRPSTFSSVVEVSESSIIKGDGKLFFIGGNDEYKLEHYHLWRNNNIRDELKAWKTFEEIICPHMILLLLAATKPAISSCLCSPMPRVPQVFLEILKI